MARIALAAAAAAAACAVSEPDHGVRPRPRDRALAVTATSSDDFGRAGNREAAIELGTGSIVRGKIGGTPGTFSATTGLPLGRDRHRLLSNNGFLYVVGGFDSTGSAARDILYAPINPSGSVGSWNTAGTLPAVRDQGGSFIWSGRLYCISGSGTGTYLTDIIFAPIAADGTLGAFATATTSPLGQGMGQANAHVWNDTLYVMGGTRGGAAVDFVYFAPLNADGTIGSFSSSNGPLGGGSGEVPRYAGHTKYLYAINVADVRGNTKSATIQPDGSVGPWQAGPAITGISWWDANPLVYGGTLWMGVAGNQLVGAALMPSGSMEAWATFGSAASAPYGRQLAGWNGRLYLAGGSDIPKSIDVSRAPLTQVAATTAPITTWSSTGTLPSARSGLGLLSSGRGTLIAAGGYGASPTAEVKVASISAAGTPGAFGGTATLGTARYWHASAVANGFLYVLGGFDGSFLTSVEYAPISATGTVGTFQTTQALPAARKLFGAVAVRNFLYVLGGELGTGLATDEVWRAAINANGTLGTWTTTTAFTGVRQGHAAVAYRNAIFVLGGYDGSNPRADVQVGVPAADGSIASWTPTSSFTTARAGLQAVGSNGFLLIMGGTGALTDVQVAPVMADATLGSWAALAAMPQERSDFGAASDGARIFLAGGLDGASAALDAVHTASLKVQPLLGLYSRTFDLGAPASTVDSISIGGSVSAQGEVLADVRYAGADAVWDPTPIRLGRVALGATLPLTAVPAATRYLQVRLTLDESGSGTTDPAAADERDVTDVTIIATTNPPAKLGFATPPRSAAAATCSAAVTIRLLDAGDNPTAAQSAITVNLSGAPAEFFSAPGCGGTAITSFPIPPGQAQGAFYFKANAAGAFTITATATGLTQAQQQGTIDVGAPATIEYTQQPTNVLVNTVIAPAVKLAFKDAGGNVVTTATAGVTVALSANPGGATLTGALTGNAQSGIATFSNLQLDRAATGYRLTATTAGLPAVQSSAFDVTAIPPATKLVFLTPAFSIKPLTCSGEITVQAQTAASVPANLPAELTVSLTAPGATLYSASGCTQGTATVKIDAGLNTASFYFKADAVGTVTVTAAAAGLTSATQDETVSDTATTPDGGTDHRTITGFACSTSGRAALPWLIALLALVALRRRRGAALLALLAFSAQAAPEARKLIAVLPLDARRTAVSAEELKAQGIDPGYIEDTIRGATVRVLPSYTVMDRDKQIEIINALPEEQIKKCAEGVCEAELGKLIGAEFVLSANLTKFGEEYKVVVKVHDVRTGALLRTSEATGPDAAELGKGLAAATKDVLRPLRPPKEVEQEEASAREDAERKRKREEATQDAEERKRRLEEESARAEIERKRRADEPVVMRGSSIPDVYAGGVFDPKQKTFGQEVLLAGYIAAGEGRIGVNIAPKVGGRAALMWSVVSSGSVSLHLGPRLLVVPLSDGVAFGGGLGAEVRFRLVSRLALVAGGSIEAYKTKTETLVAPLITLGLRLTL